MLNALAKKFYFSQKQLQNKTTIKTQTRHFIVSHNINGLLAFI